MNCSFSRFGSSSPLMVLSRARSRKFIFFTLLSIALLVILLYSGSDFRSKTYVQVHHDEKESSDGIQVVGERASFIPTKKSRSGSKLSGSLSVSSKIIDIKFPDEVLTFLSTCDKKGIQAILIEPCLLAQVMEPQEKEQL